MLHHILSMVDRRKPSFTASAKTLGLIEQNLHQHGNIPMGSASINNANAFSDCIGVSQEAPLQQIDETYPNQYIYGHVFRLG